MIELIISGLIIVLILLFLFEKRKTRKEFEKRQERYRKMI